MMYVRCPLWLRDVDDLLNEKGFDNSHKTVRIWWNRSGPLFVRKIKKRRSKQLISSQILSPIGILKPFGSQFRSRQCRGC